MSTSPEQLHLDFEKPWLLPPPVERQAVHTRSIVCRGFRRKDGLMDIEGRFVDTRPFYYVSDTRGPCFAGMALHPMQVRLTVDNDRIIKELVSTMPGTPSPGCSDINSNFQRLVGVSIGRGFRKILKERIGGVEGCTRISFLLSAMAESAVQSFSSDHHAPRIYDNRPTKKFWNIQALVNTCHTYREDGPVMTEKRAERT